MTTLILAVQSLRLADGGTVKGEGTVFEAEEPFASDYIRGGIAKPVPAQVVPKAEPKQPEPAIEPEPVPEAPAYEPVQTEETEKAVPKPVKKPRR